MIFHIATAKQGGERGEVIQEKMERMAKSHRRWTTKKKRKKKKKKEKIRKDKKHEPQQLEHLLHPAHSQDLTLDKLPPRREVLSRARRLRLITLRIGIDELFLAAYAQNREQHLRDWNHKHIW